ncbi:hypothetical protein KY345_01780 [Candidatus Woesearchaeota archaeon]|nr:hypothetical protein [Candidatus Woesearchaeota archaeon]
MIKEFLREFGVENLDNVVKIRNRYYLADKELTDLKDKINLEPESIGLFLGFDGRTEFKPSPALIDEIAKVSDRKVFVNNKAEMLFLCGRDIFGKSVMETNVRNGLVLVQNSKDENLGYGKVVNRGKLIRNILDKGSYLRREMKKY